MRCLVFYFILYELEIRSRKLGLGITILKLMFADDFVGLINY